LLVDIGDTDLDSLTAASRPARFAKGEVIVAPGRIQPPLFTLWEGAARLEIVGEAGTTHEIAEFGPGDVFGLVTRSRDWEAQPQVVALTDCEVIITDIDTAGPVISKNQDLADALDQIGTRRTRRIERLLNDPLPSTPSALGSANQTDDESDGS
jgi:CRP-like cAMP-binding protein